MRIFKRTLSMLLVLSFLFTFCVSALAANYDAGSFADMQTAFADSSGEDVSINVTDNILFDYALLGKEGITYTIGTENGSELHNAMFGGAGTVEVETDLAGSRGLEVSGDVTVNVTGDIDTYGSGVMAYGDAVVTVEGDIVAGGDGVEAYENAAVTVTGDIESTGADGVYANGNTAVTVVGDIIGWDDGVYAGENAAVTVEGDVQAAYGVHAGGEATVSITGDVAGEYYGIAVSDKASVTVNGNVSGMDGDSDALDPSDPYDYSDGGVGIYADEDSTVEVTGDVTGGVGYGPEGWGGDAVSAQGNSSVTVNGDAIGGDGDYSAGDGVDMDSTATVRIGGDVIGGDAASDEYRTSGNGVTIEFEDPDEDDALGSLIVVGSAIGGSEGNDLELDNDSDLPLSELVLPPINIGSYDSVDFDDFTDEEENALLSYLNGGRVGGVDLFWPGVAQQLRAAEKGAEITVDAGARTTMPTYILALAAEREITLIIRWNGGEDIVVKEAVDVEGSIIRFEKLAELVK